MSVDGPGGRGPRCASLLILPSRRWGLPLMLELETSSRLLVHGDTHDLALRCARAVAGVTHRSGFAQRGDVASVIALEVRCLLARAPSLAVELSDAGQHLARCSVPPPPNWGKQCLGWLGRLWAGVDHDAGGVSTHFESWVRPSVGRARPNPGCMTEWSVAAAHFWSIRRRRARMRAAARSAPGGRARASMHFARRDIVREGGSALGRGARSHGCLAAFTMTCRTVVGSHNAGGFVRTLGCAATFPECCASPLAPPAPSGPWTQPFRGILCVRRCLGAFKRLVPLPAVSSRVREPCAFERHAPSPALALFAFESVPRPPRASRFERRP